MNHRQMGRAHTVENPHIKGAFYKMIWKSLTSYFEQCAQETREKGGSDDAAAVAGFTIQRASFFQLFSLQALRDGRNSL